MRKYSKYGGFFEYKEYAPTYAQDQLARIADRLARTKFFQDLGRI